MRDETRRDREARHGALCLYGLITCVMASLAGLSLWGLIAAGQSALLYPTAFFGLCTALSITAL